MKNERLSLDRSPAPRAVQRLPAALQLLTTRMRAATTERRTSPPGSERHRRADEEVAYLNELYVRLQRRMEIPPEIWRLGDGRSRGQRRPAHPRP